MQEIRDVSQSSTRDVLTHIAVSPVTAQHTERFWPTRRRCWVPIPPGAFRLSTEESRKRPVGPWLFTHVYKDEQREQTVSSRIILRCDLGSVDVHARHAGSHRRLTRDAESPGTLSARVSSSAPIFHESRHEATYTATSADSSRFRADCGLEFCSENTCRISVQSSRGHQVTLNIIRMPGGSREALR